MNGDWMGFYGDLMGFMVIEWDFNGDWMGFYGDLMGFYSDWMGF